VIDPATLISLTRYVIIDKAQCTAAPNTCRIRLKLRNCSHEWSGFSHRQKEPTNRGKNGNQALPRYDHAASLGAIEETT
jgi:hypothetical protein